MIGLSVLGGAAPGSEHDQANARTEATAPVEQADIRAKRRILPVPLNIFTKATG
jgi:hypothetical protein